MKFFFKAICFLVFFGMNGALTRLAVLKRAIIFAQEQECEGVMEIPSDVFEGFPSEKNMNFKRSEYRKLLRCYHPDKHLSESEERKGFWKEAFQIVQNAYNSLNEKDLTIFEAGHGL